MPDVQNPQVENTDEILSLLSTEPIISQPIPSNPISIPDTTPNLLFPELPGLGSKWLPTTKKSIIKKQHKIFLQHTKLLSTGMPVEKIEHISFGSWNGCQCIKCKTDRNEYRLKSDNGIDTEFGPKVLESIATEKFFGRLLNLPNKTMKVYAMSKKLPKEAEDCWNTTEEDLKIYGEFGKHIADHYLNIPEFKHKDLVLFTLWYCGEFAARYTIMLQIIKQKAK